MSTSKRRSSLRRSNATAESGDVFLQAQFDPFQQKQQRDSFNQQIKPRFLPSRVFINQIDSYHGRKLVDFLPEQTYINPQSNIKKDSVDENETPEAKQIEDEDEMANEDAHRTSVANADKSTKKYEIIGTTSDSEYRCPEDVTMIIKDTNDRESFLSELMKCGIIIYDITQNPNQVEEGLWAFNAIQQELEKQAEATPKAFKRNDEVRYFILISTVMTWALTKPLSPEDPDLPFTESDYRKRKPHPNFKQHYQFEKDVVLLKKHPILSKRLKTLVISCGVTYGDEEGLLHYLFKMAWKNATSLPNIGDGTNVVPLLHVRDLVSIVFAVLQSWPRLRYILGVEEEALPQRVIVKKISKLLTTGGVKNVSVEQALMLPEITQETCDMMTVNLNVDPVYIVDNIHWHYEGSFRDNIVKIVEEFRKSRNLNPMKVIILGPPASGKTKIAKYLANHYDIHYIHVKSLIADTIQKLSKKLEDATRKSRSEVAVKNDTSIEPENVSDDFAGEDDESETGEDFKEQLAELKSLEKNSGRLDDIELNKIFLKQLKSKECQNQGYVIDGYPKSLEQAKGLFGGNNLTEEEELDEETEDGGMPSVNSSIMPELVVALEASDEFLRERVINRPEREIQNTHYTEEHMMRRLREYRERNSDTTTPLRFFDEIEVNLLVIPIESDLCPDMFPTISQCLEKLGKPRNYRLTVEEGKEAQICVDEDACAEEAAARLRRESEYSECKRLREEKMMEWTNLMESLKEEEEERLSILGEPLRNYLTKYIFPTLTQGLIEVAKLRPTDPIDYLAEYLFRENPEGKMFQPDHTRAMSILLDKIADFQDEIINEEMLDNGVADFLKKEFPASCFSEIVEDTTETICSNQAPTSHDTQSPVNEGSQVLEEVGEAFSDRIEDAGEA